MSANAIWRSAIRPTTRILYSRSIGSSTPPPTTSVTKPKPIDNSMTTPPMIKETLPKNQPGTTAANKLKYDEQIHTGQQWDEEDYRLVRFTYKDKEVNPNVAMNLVADIPSRAMKERVVSCDGGGGALGHPKIYINLDKPGNHGCGYCGLRFYKEDIPHDGHEHIQA